jgi:hypothetical protein
LRDAPLVGISVGTVSCPGFVLTADTYVTVVPQVAHAAAEAVARLLINAARG